MPRHLDLALIYHDRRAPWFLATMLVFGIAGGVYGGVFNNYLWEVLHISKAERGVVEFPRELPGLLVVVLIALLYRVSEVRILRLALLCCLAGMAGLAFLGDRRFTAIALIVLWSTGEHLLMPVTPSIAMHMAQPGREGLALGSSGSFGSIGQVIGYGLVPLLFIAFPFMARQRGAYPYYQVTFVVAAAVVGLGLLAAVFLRPSAGHVERKRLYFRRKFSRYYLLEVLFGGRKQVFITFAPYVLVVQYGARAELMSVLLGAVAIINILVNPLLGRLLDRLGYRAIIIIESVVLFVLCLLYGFSHRLFPHGAAFVVVCGVFVTDAVLFAAGMARSMYVKSLSSSHAEVTATLSTGVSVNHLVSILIAVAGGAVWQRLGVEALFSLSALFAVGYFAFSISLPRPTGRALDEPTPPLEA
jgi:predicted MFS family arabinose efflux permease